MTDYPSHVLPKTNKDSMPVMCCHPAKGGRTTQLVRGAAPSTPRRRRNSGGRLSIKKFFRVTPEEDALLTSHAAKAGLELSSYLRVQALGRARVRAIRQVRADWDELRRCMAVINKAGNVVNQLLVMIRRSGGNQVEATTALAELAAAARIIITILKGA